MKKIVIIGGVAGGASCAARLRRLDETADIVLLERGEYISYANCGLPYHVGDIIKSRDTLLLQTPEAMRNKFKIDVRTKHEVIAIQRDKKSVLVKRLDSGETYEESYDILVISTGSSPIRPPIPGIDSSRIQTLWTVPDADRIRALIREKGIKSAAIIGGGFIGLEMAENLRNAGLDVTLVEAQNQVMPPLDFEMAQLLHENILFNNVKLYLDDGVSSFSEENNNVAILLKSGKTLYTDLVILSIGVRPNSELAKSAGLALNTRGGIVVDDTLKTSDPSIYALGDVIEVEDFISKKKAMIPLAGPANKQGRIVANLIAGAQEIYDGTQGTAVAKVFDLTAASTGSNEKLLISNGLIKGKDYESLIITQNSHSGYYPGATPMTIKLLFSMDGKRILGAQIVGREGVDKRIDTLAIAIRMGASIQDLKKLELAYAPPYSSAKDPINMVGFVAENILANLLSFATWDVVEQKPDALILDVREEAEQMIFSLPNAVNIPLGQLRNHLTEFNQAKEIIVFCSIGVRAYNAARILMQHGFNKVKIYPGGAKFYQSTHYSVDKIPIADKFADSSENNIKIEHLPTKSMHLDCSGMQCPGPIMKIFETMKTLREGEILEVEASDPGFANDIDAWCRRTGNFLLSNEKYGNTIKASIKKGNKVKPVATTIPEGKTIVVFSGDLDKILASFIIANGAASLGRPVTMFFTFWGLAALRRTEKKSLKKTWLESIFGTILPRGTKNLKLSKMHMGGIGTALMKRIMHDKGIDSLESLIQKALEANVKIVACTMSMDVMGIKKEELIDGIELGGVGSYLGDAEESNVNLFI